MTFINYTVTPSSLENQCLNTFLKQERPDIEELRVRQLKIQGEYAVKLRLLEDQLLDQLSNSTGNILENEKLINTLDRIKVDATEINKAIGESEKVMAQIETVTSLYADLAYKSSQIYFTMYF